MRREAKQEMIVTSPKCVLIHIYTQEMEYTIRSRSKHTLQSFRELAWYHGVYICHLVDLKLFLAHWTIIIHRFFRVFLLGLLWCNYFIRPSSVKTLLRMKYSRLSLSRNRRDPQKHFEISVLRHIRFVVLRKKKQLEQPNFTNDYVI